MELYLVRHGETVWNAEGKLQGTRDIPLNSKGRELAGLLGRRLENTHIDLIFSSPLIRAYETACLVRGYRNIEIIRDDRLREISFGVEEGSYFKSWDTQDSPYKYFFLTKETAKYVPPEGGETLQHVCNRTKEFVQSEIEPLWEKYQRVMVVAHGALNAALTCYLENRGVEDFWGPGLFKNCEERIYEFDGKCWRGK